MSLFFETSYGSLNKKGEELCGDMVEIIKNGHDTIMVLADGIGSGVKANILASFTSKMVATMLAESTDIRDVIETVASTLPVCNERGITYCSFSFIHINKLGDAHIVEFDNPNIVILRNGKFYEFPRKELIIADKKIKEAHIKLKSDDICIMFSDGVINAGVEKMLSLGWQQKNVVKYLENAYKKNSTAYSMQNLLLAACNNLYGEEPGDDTTVAVCRIRKSDKAYVMVGPPINHDDDKKIVDELMNFEGTKIVCGGTTSQIVSRISGSELKVSLNYISPDVPPVAEMKGVDLVTEGVVTLKKTLEIMKKYERSAVDRRTYENHQGDAASLLAQLLINKCTGAKFIVGRALNPAHQNPNFSMDLSIKLQLVNEISESMKRLGKEVQVEYH